MTLGAWRNEPITLNREQVGELREILSTMRYSGSIALSVNAALGDGALLLRWLGELNERLVAASTAATATEEAHRQLVADVAAMRRVFGLDNVRCTAERAGS